MFLWQYENVTAARWSGSPVPHLCSPTPQQHIHQTLDRTWRPCCMACSITELKPPGFLLVGASEKHYVRWGCSWCSDPSTARTLSLWRYSDTARNIRTSEAIHDATCARVRRIPWRPLRTSAETWMGFRPCRGHGGKLTAGVGWHTAFI